MPADERENEVLRQRARRLAQPLPPEPSEGELLRAVGFSLGEEKYAVEHGCIREVLPLPPVTPLPCVPAFVRGIVNVRGRIVALLDLETILGLPAREIGSDDSLVIFQSTEREFGLLADRVFGLVAIPRSNIQPSLPTVTATAGALVKGVTADGWAVLDAGKMLADPGLVVDEDVGRPR